MSAKHEMKLAMIRFVRAQPNRTCTYKELYEQHMGVFEELLAELTIETVLFVDHKAMTVKAL